VPSPSGAGGSNQILVHSGAQFFVDGRSDIYGYTGPFCITAPISQNPACALAVPSPWGTLGTDASGTIAQGDPISIWVGYLQGATPANPGAGSGVIGFTAGSTSDVQGVIYAPNDNVTLSGGAQGSGVGKVVAFTLIYSSNNGKVIQEFFSKGPSFFGILE
jgi:hypothetical protein